MIIKIECPHDKLTIAVRIINRELLDMETMAFFEHYPNRQLSLLSSSYFWDIRRTTDGVVELTYVGGLCDDQ